MLTQIDILHLATIQELHLDFSSGATVVTGETGAGKSVIIDAIELALGGRATGDMVRVGQDKADISLSFDVSKLPQVSAWLKQHELEIGEHECIIRRTLQKDGRSKSYINGTPCTLMLVRDLSDLLINIHGQHEHQALFKLETQRDMLDKYAGNQELLAAVANLAEEWHSVSQELTRLRKTHSEHNARSDLLRFQLNELQELQLKAGEFAALETEHKQLANSGSLLTNLTTALQTLSEDENHSALSLLQTASNLLTDIQEFDKQILPLNENLKSALILVSDTESSLKHYLANVDLDPQRLQWIEARIGSLFDMARKHRVAPADLPALQDNIATELNLLDTSGERAAELAQQLQSIEQNYFASATKLTESRAKAAKKLAKEITSIIHELSLPQGKFNIHFMTDDVPRISAYGLEKIIFHITTNVGQPLQPLAKVASGGELSRISLAIHMATAEQHTIPTLIFDEIDVGISGGTAEIVGKLLRRLGQTHQLLCITHLPQVAAQGHQHLLVSKRHEAAATFTEAHFLPAKEKINELARLLGGVQITQKTVAHAKEMLEKV